MIQRDLRNNIKLRLFKGKAIVVLGPRQTGKTTLLETLASETGQYLLLDCDQLLVQERLADANIENLKQLIGKHTVVFIDEAQRVKNIGLSLKIITDQLKDVQLLVSGSSALDLTSEINEPLTGRKWEYLLLPISWHELTENTGNIAVRQQLDTRLIYGMYPDVINQKGDEEIVLRNLSNSFLYKDLLSLQSVRKPDLLPKLLKALALQLGNEVSNNELAQLLQVNKETIATYIDLLEKAFIIYRLEPLSRNLRNEISSNRKIYFYDNGIRNAVISNFSPMSMRTDAGALWENFLLAERMKYLLYNDLWHNRYFWRTRQQQEIDYVEERNGSFAAFEFKWNPGSKARVPESFKTAYSDNFQIINPENFEQFLIPR